MCFGAGGELYLHRQMEKTVVEVPEGKEACYASSDQAEFCSLQGRDDVQLLVLLIGVR